MHDVIYIFMLAQQQCAQHRLLLLILEDGADQAEILAAALAPNCFYVFSLSFI